jgi:hypothetical protein
MRTITKNEARNHVVGKASEGVMVDARPIFEEAYSKNYNVMKDDIAMKALVGIISLE